IDINMSQILIIDNYDLMKAFDTTYCAGSKQATSWGDLTPIKSVISKIYNSKGSVVDFNCNRPNWQMVARDFSGIELDPRKAYSSWSQDWACHSGCIWRKSAITA